MVSREEIRLRILELAERLLTNPDVDLEEDQSLRSMVGDLERYVFDLRSEDDEDE